MGDTEGNDVLDRRHPTVVEDRRGERLEVRLEAGRGDDHERAAASPTRASRSPVAAISTETRGVRSSSARFREMIEPAGAVDELGIAFRDPYGIGATLVVFTARTMTPEDLSSGSGRQGGCAGQRRMRAVDSRWLELDASALQDDPGGVAVVIQPAAPERRVRQDRRQLPLGAGRARGAVGRRGRLAGDHSPPSRRRRSSWSSAGRFRPGAGSTLRNLSDRDIVGR